MRIAPDQSYRIQQCCVSVFHSLADELLHHTRRLLQNRALLVMVRQLEPSDGTGSRMICYSTVTDFSSPGAINSHSYVQSRVGGAPRSEYSRNCKNFKLFSRQNSSNFSEGVFELMKALR